MSDVTIQRAKSAADLQDAFFVRRQVFVLEQNVPEHLELDEWDNDLQTVHILARDHRGAALGAARMRPYKSGGAAKIERVAVLAPHRGIGLGRALMTHLEHAAHAAEFEEVILNAQLHARTFYERMGYNAYGESFVEAGIEHVAMRKALIAQVSGD